VPTSRPSLSVMTNASGILSTPNLIACALNVWTFRSLLIGYQVSAGTQMEVEANHSCLLISGAYGSPRRASAPYEAYGRTFV
jgi:hypothetical protein